MANAWNRTGRLSFKNLGDRTLAPCWSLAGSSKRNDDIDSNYKNETYREDIFMAFSSKLGTTVETTTEEILSAIKNAKIDPKSIGGLQRKTNGIEILCHSEKTYETLLEEGIKIEGFQDNVVFKPKRKRNQAVKIFGLGMDVFDAVLEEALCKFGKIKDGRQHQLKLKEEGLKNEWGHVSNGDRVVYMTIEQQIPRRLMVANEWVTVWYVGQPKSCRHCNESHKSEDCVNLTCYNCNGRGHMARDCKEKKQTENVDTYEDISEDSDDEKSPPYTPNKEIKVKEAEWSEDMIDEKIEQDGNSTIHKKEEIDAMLVDLEKQLSKERKKEGEGLIKVIEPIKAVDIYIQHKKDTEEIRKSKNMKLEEKEQMCKEHLMYMYVALKIMKKENIAGRYGDTIVRFSKNKRKNRTEESPSTGGSKPKNGRHR